MNTKLLLKTVFLIAVLLLLVIMGMHNGQSVDLRMPPIFKGVTQPAAFMYFAFFALGVLSGTILTAGTKGGGGSRAPKGDK